MITKQTFFNRPDGFMTVRHLTIHGTNFHKGLFTASEVKVNNACVDVFALIPLMGDDAAQRSTGAGVQARTLWHCLCDQQAGTVEFSFYLGDDVKADGSRTERRSGYLQFALEPELAPGSGGLTVQARA